VIAQLKQIAGRDTNWVTAIQKKIAYYQTAVPLFVAGVTMSDGRTVETIAFLEEIEGVGAVIRRQSGNRIDFLNYANVAYIRLDNIAEDFVQRKIAVSVSPSEVLEPA